MGKLILTLSLCASCSIPLTQLSPDVAVKQITYSQGKFFHKVETTIKNTSEYSYILIAKCSSKTGGMEQLRVKNLAPGETYFFTDKVPSTVNGEVHASCDFYTK